MRVRKIARDKLNLAGILFVTDRTNYVTAKGILDTFAHRVSVRLLPPVLKREPK